MLLALAGLWREFAPSQLGGLTTYAVTEGISMEPSIHAGDLALVRPAATYHVGDVVLYQSSVVGQPVLHRILLRQGGNYFFQGDNNDFVDPGYATPQQLIGKLWVRVPRVGAALGWIGHPFNAAILAALAAIGVGLTLTPSRSRRRRHRTAPLFLDPDLLAPTTMSAAINSESGDGRGKTALGRSSNATHHLASTRPSSFLGGPVPTLLGLVISVILAGLLLGVGYALPAQRTVQVTDAYRQSGTFSYQAKPRAATPVYPHGVVNTGDPIYPSLVDSVAFTFRYKFTSALPHQIHGTIALRALLQSQDGAWQTLSPLKTSIAFVGDSAAVTAHITLRDLYVMLDTVTAQSGSQPGSYSADIEPVVSISGHVGGYMVVNGFNPTLPIEIDPSAITLKVTTGAPPPGATYIPPTREEELSSSFKPTITGTIPGQGPNAISVARYHPSVDALRVAGVVFGAIALSFFVAHEIWRRRRHSVSEEQVLARRMGVRLVPVDELPLVGTVCVRVPTFSDLAGLAQYLERPVLYIVRDGIPTFALEDGTRSYLNAPEPPPMNAEAVIGQAASAGSRPDHSIAT